MAALRQFPLGGRQFFNTASVKPCTPQLRAYATGSQSHQPAALDVETESGLAAPVFQRKDVKVVDPRRRASARPYELPHGRYRYHPPKYYRGPMHPVQPPPASDPVARNYSPGPFNIPRFKATYDSHIAADIMTLAYKHTPPGTPKKPERIRLRDWDDSSPYMKNRPLRGPRGHSTLLPLEKDIDFKRIPEIIAVHLSCYTPRAKMEPDRILVGKSVLQTITGVRPQTTLTKTQVSSWKIVPGDKTGTKVSVYGNQAYEFVDKLVSLVLPKIKEWPGVKGSTGDSSGNILLGLTPAAVLFFPEVEANHAMYPPKMVPGMRISIETTASSDRQARLLCSAHGLPFYGKMVD